MLNDLYDFIQQTPMIDTHEHLASEDEHVNDSPDVLQTLFDFYPASDLQSAGATQEAVLAAVDSSNPDIEARWNGIKEAWELMQYTGYGETVRLIAQHVYGMETITLDALVDAEALNQQLYQPGERLRLLKDVANLDHVQIDDFVWACEPDEAGADFFLYDLSWVHFCRGDIPAEDIYNETGVTVTDLKSLREAMEALYAKYGNNAIAVKSQHAYNRTLKWELPNESFAESTLKNILRGDISYPDQQLILGNWGWEQGLQLAEEYNLPFKIHTGYLAGNDNYVDPDRVRPLHFAELFKKYPNVKFVLMHTGYPWTGEILTLAKHFPNVYIDMCWAWSINPFDMIQFVRSAIHSVPLNKIFLFGGDTRWAPAVIAYAMQARQYFYRAMEQEVSDGYLTEQQAIKIAARFMQENQRACFDIEGTRTTLAQA